MFTQRAAAGWSFTDCTSKVVIDELQLNAAVALDEHFRQFGIAVFP
jgi:predicted nucleic acid-binding protein